MKLLSINIGKKGKHNNQKTGIFKEPAGEKIRIEKTGVVGDIFSPKKTACRPDQAIYIYGLRDYAWWEEKLGRKLPMATFSENLTISDLASSDFSVGDILQIGETRLQVTAPRIPCEKISIRMEDPLFLEKFNLAERPGIYCRVLQEGTVQVGDTVQVEKYTGETVSLLDVYRDYYAPTLNEDIILRFLNAPISSRTRAYKEKQLEKVRA